MIFPFESIAFARSCEVIAESKLSLRRRTKQSAKLGKSKEGDATTGVASGEALMATRLMAGSMASWLPGIT